MPFKKGDKTNKKYWLGKKRPDMVGKKFHLGFKHSLETKERMRLKKLGMKPTESQLKGLKLGRKQLGVKRSPETRQKIRLSLLGKPGRRLGYKIPKEIRDRMREIKVASPNRKFKDTSIEIKVETALKNLSLFFKKQEPLCKVAIVDFYIPEAKLVIQCDGCFWHGCPEHNPKWVKNKDRDLNQDKVLNENGFRVIRFWEHDINNNIGECINRIKGLLK